MSSNAKRSLPVASGGSAIRRSSLLADGTRVRIVPADVDGRFTRARRIVFAVLVLTWLALPTVRIGGHPAVFLDVHARAFFLFGKTFNAQDLWLVFFLLTSILLSVVTLTALVGRMYCGFACPQTVFLEGVYRPLERLVLGSRDARGRTRAVSNRARVLRTTLLHGIYVLVSLGIANFFVGYFVSMPGLWEMIRSSPAAHPEAFVWMVAVAALFYGNFAFFREQMCLVVCPYGRMQSVLYDEDTRAIGYDARRGEPRGRLHAENRGDCVDCNRCVTVCPTGIDIRNGLQVDCVACGSCVDACNEVMQKLARPTGLVRYDSANGFGGKPRRLIRGRVVVYAALTALSLIGSAAAARSRKDFEANVLRLRGAPYSIEGDTIQNAFEVHLVNKTAAARDFHIDCASTGPLQFTRPTASLELQSLGERRVPLFVRAPLGTRDTPFRCSIGAGGSHDHVSLEGRFLAPLAGGTR